MRVEVRQARQSREAGKGWEVWVDGRFTGHYGNNRAAWRAADRISGEGISRAEDVTEWINRKD